MCLRPPLLATFPMQKHDAFVQIEKFFSLMNEHTLVQALLVSLILDRKIEARIDQVFKFVCMCMCFESRHPGRSSFSILIASFEKSNWFVVRSVFSAACCACSARLSAAVTTRPWLSSICTCAQCLRPLQSWIALLDEQKSDAFAPTCPLPHSCR